MKTNTRRGLRGVVAIGLCLKLATPVRLLLTGAPEMNVVPREKIPQRKLSLIAGAICALLAASISTPTAQAAEKGYRYWGYYQAGANSTQWKAAMTGPTVDIADGSVEGWIFTFSSNDIPSTPPSVKPRFATICGKTKPKKGFKRIALVIDFGNPAIAPKGDKVKSTITRCVVTAEESQGIDVLAQELRVRTDKSGLLCGLNGYPSRECGAEIAAPKALTKKK
jgi:hypothetical protein